MDGFTLSNSTTLEFGAGALERCGEIVRKYGAHKVLLHCDGGDVLEKTGVLKKVRDSLKAADLEVVEVGGVVSNPKLSLAKKAIDIC